MKNNTIINTEDYEDKFLFIPLGGSNEIGMNLNLYHLNGKWLIVDCGAGFADDDLPGIDMMVPDATFIRKYKKDIVGMVLTHAHEDHIGGIHFLWTQLECDIYATTFTANFLKNRMSEYSFASRMNIIQVEPGAKINLHPFDIEMIPLTHSAPEMQALMIRTDKGNIMHTGDWKFDPDPVVGPASDEATLKKCGDEGILALVCDSTNVFSPGTSGSEGDLKRSIADIVKKCPKLVVVTTFASNLARLETLLRAAQLAGRKVIFAGRSLHRIYDAALDSGYLGDIDFVIDDKEFSNHKREDVLIIATGCQGEPLAATSKFALEAHPHIKLQKGDTVIFSSKIIPGNERKIFRLFNTFVKKGIETITERDHFVHVSGHPSIEELKRMYALTRPRVCIPVHGEASHLHEHCKLARESGIKSAVEVENGVVVELDQDNSKVIGSVHSGYLAVDGNYLIPAESRVLKTRRRIRDAGAVFCSITISSDGNLLKHPYVSCPGCIDIEDDFELLKLIKNGVSDAIRKSNNIKSGRFTEADVEDAAKGALRRILKAELGKIPLMDICVNKLK
jgi:ribonuclease J